jgi:isoleucyl-tRNA synthetase
LLKNANDWNLSRSRFWEFICLSGEPKTTKKKFDWFSEELYNEIENRLQQVPTTNPFQGFEIGNMAESNYDLVDLHKNVVDEITLVSASGKPMKREADLIDGLIPFYALCTMALSFENKDKIEKQRFSS